MKKVTLSLVMIILAITVLAQTPQAFKYQALVRNNSGEILQNQSVGVRISIHDVTAGGTIVYQETFTESTNQYGLVNLEIGFGAPTIGTFTGIDWGSNSKFLEVEIDPSGGTTYVSIGTSELLSAPYALYAEDDGDWESTGNDIFSTNSGSVGIGLNNPLYKLHVNGKILVGSENKGIKMYTTGLFVDLESLGTDLAINYLNGTNTLLNVVSGSVGIGTTVPDVTFHVGRGSDIELDEGGHLILGYSDGLNIGMDNNEIMARVNGSASNLHLNHEGGNVMISAAGDGKLGIGTSSPGATLDVRGRIWQTGTGESVIIGEGAGVNDDLSTKKNIFIGYNAGNANTTGWRNTVNGSYALYSNTTGYRNTASGSFTLFSNTTGFENTACGGSSLRDNTEGNFNTANGNYSLRYNTTGSNNTASGYSSFFTNTTGFENTATGSYSLYSNITGAYNVATGFESLKYNTTGNGNTAIGYISLWSNTTGQNNTAIGLSAYSSGNYSNSTALGHDAEPGASNKIMLGNSSVTWIGGHSSWHNTSDARMKNNIQEDVKGLDFIMELRPLTYYYDIEKMNDLIGVADSSDYAEKYNKEKIKQSGFLAQEVEQAAQNSGYDFSGVCEPKGDVKYYSLAYAEFVVPLVKAVQELAQENEELRQRIEMLENQN